MRMSQFTLLLVKQTKKWRTLFNANQA
uniref:Uncharacterized protein n=1 Tax=Arundo donax TaxID=35708 RepID=A0A0A9CI63_ARUDO